MKNKKYTFDKVRHIHSLGGKPLYGVTTVLGVIAKPALIQWSANMAVKHIEDNFPTAQMIMDGFVFSDLFKSAKIAHSGKKTQAGDIGTTVHELIENWIKSGCPDDEYLDDISDDQIKKMYCNFRNWARKEEVVFILSEQNVYSELHWYGGICDFVCLIGDKKYIGDVKTSSGIYPEHFLQMAAYDIAFQERGHECADGYVVVNLQKSGVIQVKKLKADKKYRDGFLHALGLFKTLESMKPKKKYEKN